MLSNLKLKQQGMLLILIPLVFEIAFVVSVGFFFRQAEIQSDAAQKELHQMKPVNNVMQLYVEDSMSLLLFALTQKESFSDKFEKNNKRIDQIFSDLRKDVADQPKALELFNRLKRLSDGLIDVSRSFMEQIQGGNSISTLSFLTNNKDRNRMMGLLVDIGSTLNEFETLQEKEELKLRQSLRYTNSELSMIMGATVIMNFFLSGVLAVIYRQTIVLRLERVSRNCKAVAEGKTLSTALTGSNEIAHLDRIFHQMAAKLKEDEQREKGVVEDAVDVICTVDSVFSIQSINSAAERFWGYSKQELLNTRVISLIVAEQQTSAEEFFNFLPSSGEAQRKDFVVICKNSDTLEMRWTARKNERGITYCVIRDISAEKETERLKDSMVSMISHDLRTPATSIQVFLSMLDMGIHGQVSEEGKLEIAKAQSSCKNLISMISNFLDLEKIDSGSFNLQADKSDLSSILDSVCSELELPLEKRGIALDLEDRTRGVNLQGSTELLNTCFTNLIDLLSRRSDRRKRILIRIDEHKMSQEGKSKSESKGSEDIDKNQAEQGFVELRITGFDLEEINRVLETPFRELVASSADSEDRFVEWMNLAHFNAIIKLHGGTVRCETLESVESSGEGESQKGMNSSVHSVLVLRFQKLPKANEIAEAKGN